MIMQAAIKNLTLASRRQTRSWFDSSIAAVAPSRRSCWDDSLSVAAFSSCLHHRRSYHSSSFSCFGEKEDATITTAGGGAGIGNVRDRMMHATKGWDDLYIHTLRPNTVRVIGAPLTYGQPFVGTDTSPALLKNAGLFQMLSSLGWRVEDYVDDGSHLDFDSIAQIRDEGSSSSLPNGVHARNCSVVGRCNQKLADVVEETLKEGRFPLVLGGDHSIGIGSLAGILRARPDTGVIWVDAHADLNTPTTSESGNMHGMPVGILMEDEQQQKPPPLPGFEWLTNGTSTRWLSPSSIVYIGLRDVDAPERAAIREKGILAFTMYEIDKYGIGKVLEMALQHLLGGGSEHPSSSRPLHVSYDIDVVDPQLAPATGTTVRGGLTYREALFVAEEVAACGSLASAEIVELNPTLSDRDGAQDTIDLGLKLITSMMGKSII